MGQLMKKVTEAHGEGFEIDSIVDGEAVATRQVTITEVRQGEKSQIQEVRLPRTVKPTDGEKMAVKLADQHGDGWEMTKFEPFLGKAVLTKLTPATARCRGAAALALGVKPGRSRWPPQGRRLRSGAARTYMPSALFEA
jgi:replicative DNA helicase